MYLHSQDHSSAGDLLKSLQALPMNLDVLQVSGVHMYMYMYNLYTCELIMLMCVFKYHVWNEFTISKDAMPVSFDQNCLYLTF